MTMVTASELGYCDMWHTYKLAVESRADPIHLVEILGAKCLCYSL